MRKVALVLVSAVLVVVALLLISRALGLSGPARAFKTGVKYYLGQGVQKDKEEAAKWYRKAADQGDVRAQCSLGVMYEMGDGVPQDKAEAARWYRKAAEQGSAQAQCNLGVMCEMGDGVPQDKAEAVQWYRKAADQADAAGQINLGGMYERGDGVPQDKAEAARWYRKAADQGDADGMSGLAWILVTAPELLDAKEGLVWATKAAKAKPDAGSILNTLACAYAANGDFDAAAKTEQHALEVTIDPERKQAYMERIGAFQKNLTYIEYQKSKGK